MKAVFLASIIACLPVIVHADGALASYRTDSDICMQNINERGGEAACRGLLFAACRPVEGIEVCMRAEAQFWEQQLGLQYARAYDELARQDVAFPINEKRADLLAAAQDAWSVYRNAECRVAAVTTPSDAYCLESTTFARVMVLVDLQEPLQ